MYHVTWRLTDPTFRFRLLSGEERELEAFDFRVAGLAWPEADLAAFDGELSVAVTWQHRFLEDPLGVIWEPAPRDLLRLHALLREEPWRVAEGLLVPTRDRSRHEPQTDGEWGRPRDAGPLRPTSESIDG